MISDTRVRALARQDGVTAGLAEKHYVELVGAVCHLHKSAR